MLVPFCLVFSISTQLSNLCAIYLHLINTRLTFVWLFLSTLLCEIKIKMRLALRKGCVCVFGCVCISLLFWLCPFLLLTKIIYLRKIATALTADLAVACYSLAPCCRRSAPWPRSSRRPNWLIKQTSNAHNGHASSSQPPQTQDPDLETETETRP